MLLKNINSYLNVDSEITGLYPLKLNFIILEHKGVIINHIGDVWGLCMISLKHLGVNVALKLILCT